MNRTFQEWSRRGYSIKKGSKSIGKNQNGEPLFSYKQVNNPKYARDSWDSADDLNTCGGPMYGIYGNCD